MPHEPDTSYWSPSFRRGVVAVVVGLAVLVVLYRWLTERRLEQTSALFIGLPTALACTVALLARPRSGKASCTGFMAIALLASGPLLGEGFVCILMASPLALLVALLLGAAWDRQQRHDQERQRARRRHLRSLSVAVPLLLVGLEGVTDGLSWSRAERVVVEATVDAPAAAVEAALARVPRFERPLPSFLRLGFPAPVAASGAGLERGDERRIRFAGGEGRPGELRLVVHERRPGEVVFRAVADGSHIAHWLDWQLVSVRWAELPGGGTRVTWEARYDRRLDPAWYFGPLERHAVGLALEHLHACLVVDGAAAAGEVR